MDFIYPFLCPEMKASTPSIHYWSFAKQFVRSGTPNQPTYGVLVRHGSGTELAAKENAPCLTEQSPKQPRSHTDDDWMQIHMEWKQSEWNAVLNPQECWNGFYTDLVQQKRLSIHRYRHILGDIWKYPAHAQQAMQWPQKFLLDTKICEDLSWLCVNMI